MAAGILGGGGLSQIAANAPKVVRGSTGGQVYTPNLPPLQQTSLPGQTGNGLWNSIFKPKR